MKNTTARKIVALIGWQHRADLHRKLQIAKAFGTCRGLIRNAHKQTDTLFFNAKQLLEDN
jgi:hypothetical protein